MTQLFEREHAVEPLDGEKGRKERGAFYTPDALARAICRTLLDDCDIYPNTILEPGCGGGAFLRAAASTWPQSKAIVGVDLEPACQTGSSFAVYRRDLFAIYEKFGLIVGNPDYAIAEKAVRHCLNRLEPKCHLAFLLRAAFLGSSGRAPLYREHPLRFFRPIAQRPSFTTDGGTDRMEYGLFVWEQGFKGRGEILPPLVWR